MATELKMEGGGVLRLWEETGRVFFRCQRELRRDGLYKVWIGGEGDELLLGTLVPEGGWLCLGRTLPREELVRRGCWPVRRALCRMAFSFQQPGGGEPSGHWHWEECPQRLVDEETRGVGEWQRMLVRRQGEELELAWPLGAPCPIPLTALICFGTPRQVGDGLCLVWRFDGAGRPRLPGAPTGDRAR